MRVLVDTSAWIDYLRDRSGLLHDANAAAAEPHVAHLHALLMPPSAVVLTPLVYQELLQGAADDSVFARHVEPGRVRCADRTMYVVGTASRQPPEVVNPKRRRVRWIMKGPHSGPYAF